MNSALYQPQHRSGVAASSQPRPRVFVIHPPQTKPRGIEPTAEEIGHTPGHRDCPACGRRSLLKSDRPLAEMTFPDAFEAWMRARFASEHQETQVRYITKKSEETYREYARSLGKFFSETTLSEIHDGHLRTYQEWRGINHEHRWPRKAAQNRVAKEVGILIRVLKAARIWNDDLRESFRGHHVVDADREHLGRIRGDIYGFHANLSAHRPCATRLSILQWRRTSRMPDASDVPVNECHPDSTGRDCLPSDEASSTSGLACCRSDGLCGQAWRTPTLA